MDFSYSNYWTLPYHYVVVAVDKVSQTKQQELHEQERPVALLSSLMANSGRDPKKKKEPYSMEDFCLYKPTNSEDVPDYYYGSAAIQALERGLLPNWALFCFKALAASASDAYKPQNAIMHATDAILLHPTKVPGGSWTGMMIAQESCSGKPRLFTTEGGDQIWLRMPKISTKVVAEEGVTLHPLAKLD